jgi:hypothetical protein
MRYPWGPSAPLPPHPTTAAAAGPGNAGNPLPGACAPGYELSPLRGYDAKAGTASGMMPRRERHWGRNGRPHAPLPPGGPLRYPTLYGTYCHYPADCSISSCPRSAWARTERPLRGPLADSTTPQPGATTRTRSVRSVRYDAEHRNEVAPLPSRTPRLGGLPAGPGRGRFGPGMGLRRQRRPAE